MSGDWPAVLSATILSAAVATLTGLVRRRSALPLLVSPSLAARPLSSSLIATGSQQNRPSYPMCVSVLGQASVPAH